MALPMSSMGDDASADTSDEDNTTTTVNYEAPPESTVENKGSTVAKMSETSFTDMFAAGDRKAPVATITSSKFDKKTVKSALENVSNEEIKSSGKSISELRAELLRLEAEKDQLIIDKERLERDSL